MLEHRIVRHKLTRERFIMKIIPVNAPDHNVRQANAELKALQVCSSWAMVSKLVDYFLDEH